LGVLRVATSVAYLRKRLADIGRYDLLEACERGEVSTYAAAEDAGLVTRREVLGTGSPNQAKKRAWKLMQITRQSPQATAPPLAKNGDGKTEFSPEPAPPKFSQDSRDIITRLVEAGRADLVIAVTERRISPWQAARIAERGEHRRVASTPSKDEHTKATPTPPPPPPVKTEKKAKPAVTTLDPRALIA
jgi:hypothetical protein